MVTAAQRVELLSRVPLFAGVSKGTLRRLAALGRETIHEPGQAIVQEGRTAHSLHVIVEGSATVRVKSRVVGRLSAGDFFGEIALLDRGPRAATVTADTRVVTLAVEGTALRGLIEADARLAVHLLAHLAAKVRELDRRLFD